MKKKTITIWIDEAIHNKFKASCASRGKSMSDALKRVVLNAINRIVKK